MNHRNQVDLETPAISALAVASKTPFWTAFKITLGIGLGRLLLFLLALGSIVTAIVLSR